MNPQKRQQTINTHTKVCSYCGFTENPLNVSNCLRCNRVMSSVVEQVSKTKVNHSRDFERDTSKSSSDMWS
ncbi:MAG: hypothetical protein ACRC1Z_23260, partial [Waterburya sp.]